MSFSGKDVRQAVQPILDVLEASPIWDKPFSGITPDALHALVRSLPYPKAEGQSFAAVAQHLLAPIVAHSINPSHPLCMAHLHCPPKVEATAVDLLISSLNQSMDSWDQAAAATELEPVIIAWLAQHLGWTAAADGVFTSGGTMSNHLGILLAREAKTRSLGYDAMEMGVGAESTKWRILCSEKAHFSVAQAAAICGLGRRSVVAVATDEKMQMDPVALSTEIDTLRAEGLEPIAVVGTAGTTSYGSVDPLEKIAKICRAEKLWFHVDAAYGFALLWSHAHKGWLQGLELADSIACDFHKLFFQPVACGAFLVRDPQSLGALMTESDYLDRAVDRKLGYRNLVGKSMQTTRRFDALKFWASMQVMGLDAFGRDLDRTIALAKEGAKMAVAFGFEVPLPTPTLNTILFRVPGGDGAQTAQRLTMLHEGRAVLGQCEHDGRQFLKMTLLHPDLTIDALRGVLSELAHRGQNS